MDEYGTDIHTERMRICLYEAVESYSCGIAPGKFFEWKCYTNNNDVWRCVNPRHDITYGPHNIVEELYLDYYFQLLWWFWFHLNHRVLRWKNEIRNFYFSCKGRQLSRFHTLLNSIQLNDCKLLYFYHTNIFSFHLIKYCNSMMVYGPIDD